MTPSPSLDTFCSLAWRYYILTQASDTFCLLALTPTPSLTIKVPEGAPTPLDVPMLYPGIVALNPLTGEYVVKVAETDDNSIMEIWLESPDTFLKIYTEVCPMCDCQSLSR